MALRDIKSKIKSVDRTRKVTRAMEMVSAVKMRKSQIRAISGRPYAVSALSILERLGASLSAMKHPFTRVSPVSTAALIVITSDKGLCGVLNSAVLKEATRRVAALSLPTDTVSVYAFGRKGAEFFERRGYRIVEKFENVSDEISLSDLARVTKEIAEAFSKKEYDRVDIIYTNFRSTFEQSAISGTVLPLSLHDIEKIVAGIIPEKGKFSPNVGLTMSHKVPASYTVEPSPEEVLAFVLPRLVSTLFYHALLESKASEHSARMVAMKNASDKSRDRSKLLTRKYNKARQAIITREVSEIVGGIEAMAVN